MRLSGKGKKRKGITGRPGEKQGIYCAVLLATAQKIPRGRYWERKGFGIDLGDKKTIPLGAGKEKGELPRLKCFHNDKILL
jgi:hypothetical protein